MLISRRDFIHAGCAIAAASLVPDPVEAWIHGSVAGNQNRAVINFNPSTPPYANLAKGFLWTTLTPQAGTLTSDGYPSGTISSNIGCNPSLLSNYFGDYVTKFSGTGSLQFSPSALIRATYLSGVLTGGVVTSVAGTSGDLGGNMTISAKTNAKVVWTPGAVIVGMSAGASNGTGGNYVRVQLRTNFTNNLSGSGSASTRILNLQNSPASNNGPLSGQLNALGEWNYTVIDGSNIDITTNTSTGAVSVWNSGSPWVSGGEIVTTPVNLTVDMLAGTYTSFSSLVCCTTGNESAVDSGLTWDPNFVTQLQYLFNHTGTPFANRGWIRFMDVSNVQASLQSDFTNRMPKTYISYVTNNFFNNNYWTSGGVSNGAADGKTFTCNTGRTGAYQDLEIIQGVVAATNTDQNPTLNDNSRGAVPIFDISPHPYVIDIQLVPTLAQVGTVLNWVFTASWISGGTHTFTYTVQSGDQNLDLFNWSLKIFNLMAADSVIGNSGTSPIQWGNALSGGSQTSGNSLIYPYPQTAKTGSVLSVAFSGISGMCSTYRLPASTLSSGNPGTFQYSADLGGFMYGNVTGNQGLNVSIPVETVIELCNSVGAHCWWNWPVNTSAAYITAFTSAMADPSTGLTQGLRFGQEIGNELWNSTLGVYVRCLAFGTGLGWSTGSLQATYGWTINRLMQYRALSYAAWTGDGRSPGDLYTLWMGSQSQAALNQAFDLSGLQAQPLNTSTFPLYSSYGGLSGGLGALNWNSSSRASAYTGDFGGRPCDGNVTATGMAMYWFSDYIGEVAAEITGTVAQNANWLQAALDYANGLTSTAFSELVTTFTTHRGSALVASGTYNNTTGQVVLTLASTINWGTLTVGDIVVPIGLTTTTGSLASLTGNGFTSVATTSGTTVTFNASAGLGGGSNLTITGGILVDRTASNINPGQSGSLASFGQIYAPNFEAICEQYDTSRAGKGASKMGILHYEGAPQFSFSTSLNNGTNSVNDTVSLTALTNQITSLSWNVSAYTKSGTNSASEMAQMILNTSQGWKLDLAGLSPTNLGTAANTGSYKGFIKSNYYQALVNASAGKGRETKPAQYGYDGPADTWGFFPNAWPFGGQYGSYDAMHEFNAGG